MSARDPGRSLARCLEQTMQLSHLTLAAAVALATVPVAHAQEGGGTGAAPAAEEADAKKAEAPAEKAAPADDAKEDEGEAKETDGDAEKDEGAAVPDAAAAKEPAASAPPKPAPAEGSLSVSSSPSGASIWIDDKDTGSKTPAVDLKVAPGTHTLKVVMGERSKSVTFHLEAGGMLNLNLNLPEATPVKKPEPKKDKEEEVAKAEKEEPAVAAPAPEPWTWMTVAGWAGLGLGTLGLVAGAVVLTTPYDPDQGPLGFGLFGTGAGLVLGGGVLLYLDNELNSEPAPADAQADEGEKAATLLPVLPQLAGR